MKNNFNKIINKLISFFRLIFINDRYAQNVNAGVSINESSGKRLSLASGMYFNGKREGYFRTYNRAGKLVFIEKYKEGKLISTKHINQFI